MKTYRVRSYVSLEINIEAASAQEAIDLASAQIHQAVFDSFDYDYFEDAIVYDENYEEIDVDSELTEEVEE